MRAVHRGKRARYVRWTGDIDLFPPEWLDRLFVGEHGLLWVQTRRGRLSDRRGDYVVEGTRGLYPVPRGIYDYNWDFNHAEDVGWGDRRKLEVEFVIWTGDLADLPADWRARGNFSLNEVGKLAVQCLEGRVLADEGDSLIHGPFGEFYPQPPETFAESYSVIDTRAVAL